jgi:hypothetical protein
MSIARRPTASCAGVTYGILLALLEMLRDVSPNDREHSFLDFCAIFFLRLRFSFSSLMQILDCFRLCEGVLPVHLKLHAVA